MLPKAGAVWQDVRPDGGAPGPDKHLMRLGLRPTSDVGAQAAVDAAV